MSRDQPSLFPPCIDDYVGPDNPVRAIDAYVEHLDLKQLGFRHADRGGGSGQPPYDPSDLLRLYLYGYLNQVRSSRRLAQESRRNVELIWLLKGLQPGYRTIATFRRENWSALKAANREFVILLRALDLLGGDLVAIDGSFFHGDASKASISTEKALRERLAALDRDIEAYGEALASNDATERADASADTDGGMGGGMGGGMDGGAAGGGAAEKMAGLLAKRDRVRGELSCLEASGAGQLSRTDGNARLLSKSGQVVAGYNVQIAVDARHKLLVASEVVNDGNDTGQLHALAKAAQAALGVETLAVVADCGYYNGEALKACEAEGIVAYVPPPERGGRLKAQGRFSREEFIYDAAMDAYRCPGDALLRPTKRLRRNAGRQEIRYTSRKAACDGCALRGRCLSAKGQTREILRWVHEDVLERHRARMTDADAMMRTRAGLAEHPFGTLKCRAGYRHFLVRGFDRVRGEWSLMALCYNFTRLLNIFGVDGFIAELAKRQGKGAVLRLFAAVRTAIRLARVVRTPDWAARTPKLEFLRQWLNAAT
ncbi:MAG TPA: IS1182 family transposase [Alphaproteobacteria bacterium]|nr:IS1182 family transposase [Alphaproteobacteria bacterium]